MMGGFESQQWLGIFLFATTSKPALGPPSSYPVASRGFFPRGEAAGA